MTTDLFDAGCYFGFLDAGYYLSNAVKMTIGWLVGMPCHSSCFSSYKSYEAQDGRSEMGTRPDA